MSPQFQLHFPCQISQQPSIVLDRISDSMFYMWFPSRLASDIILINIQRAAREIERDSNSAVMVDIGYFRQGRIVIRINLAESQDHSKELWKVVLLIGHFICLSNSPRTGSSFLGKMFPGSAR